MTQHIIFEAGNNPNPQSGVKTQATDTLSCINRSVNTMTPKMAKGPGTAAAFSKTAKHLPPLPSAEPAELDSVRSLSNS
jgi:hypothetical protein